MLPIPAGSYTNLTVTAAVTTKPTVLIGFHVNSTNAGTIVFRDGSATGTVINGTITPAIGWHFLPVTAATGLHATIGGTALDVTIIYTNVGGT